MSALKWLLIAGAVMVAVLLVCTDQASAHPRVAVGIGVGPYWPGYHPGYVVARPLAPRAYWAPPPRAYWAPPPVRVYRPAVVVPGPVVPVPMVPVPAPFPYYWCGQESEQSGPPD